MHSAGYSASDACFYTFKHQIAAAVSNQSNIGKDKEGGWRETNVGRNEKWEPCYESFEFSSLPLSQGKN